MMLRIFLIIAFVMSCSNASFGGILRSDLSFEFDGDLTNSPFGSITITENTATNALDFRIDIDTSKLGPDSDIHQFGFQIGGFSGQANEIDHSGDGNLIIGPNKNTTVAGVGNVQFGYLVDFGPGQPTLNPAFFSLKSSNSLHNLTLANFSSADVLTKGSDSFHFAIHVQSTSPDNPGSEALGGLWGTQSNNSNSSIVPEPTSYGIWVGFLAVMARTRKRLA